MLYDDDDELSDYFATNFRSLTDTIRLKSSLTKSERKHETAAMAVINPNAVNEFFAVSDFKILRNTKFTIVRKTLATMSVKFKTVAGESGCVISVTKLNVIGTIGTRKMPAREPHKKPTHLPAEGTMTKDMAKIKVEHIKTARNINKYLPVRSKMTPMEAADIAPKRTKQIAMIA